MAGWKLVIVSGASAALSSLTLDTALGVAYGGTGTASIGLGNFLVGSAGTTYTNVGSNGSGTVVRTTGATAVIMSGSFSGSYIGNGSGLTGLTATTIFNLYGDNGTSSSFNANTDNIRFVTSSAYGFNFAVSGASPQIWVTMTPPQDLRTTANSTFNRVNVAQSISASNLQLSGLATGAGNGVLTLETAGNVASRSIDSRVWGSTLIDGAGANTRVAYFSGASTLTSNSGFTFNGTNLTIGTSTFGTDVIIGGDLTVLGNVIQMEIANLSVEDRFILLNSGSGTGDGGIIIQTTSTSSFSGSAFGWYSTISRFGVQQNTTLGASAVAMIPDAYLGVVVDVDGGLQTDIAIHQKPGNIKIVGSASYIWF